MFRELSVALVLGVLLLVLAVFAPGFYQPQPLLSLLAREAPTLVVACGMALVIICRQIDISVGSQFSVCSVCAGLLAAMHWPLALVLARVDCHRRGDGRVQRRARGRTASAVHRRHAGHDGRPGAKDCAGCARATGWTCPTASNGSA